MTPKLHIRAATPSDAELLAEFGERTFRDAFGGDNSSEDMEMYVRDSFSLDRVRSELADHNSTFLIAFLDGGEQPGGYAKLRSGPPDPAVKGTHAIELQRIYVDQSAIGHGVGAALMRASLDAAGAAGRKTLWLGVWEHNHHAISFYEKWEFETVGDHEFWLGSNLQVDLIMERPVSGKAC